jgi:hypothetical protein
MTSHAQLLPVYQQFRQVSAQLNHKLVQCLSKAVLHEGGRRLGILKKETLVFESEEASFVLMDFCIHNVRIDGLNAVQRYLKQSPPPPDSQEMALLTAMLAGHYSLVQVVDAERGVGVTVFDALRGDTYFIADIGLGNSGEAGALLATRLFHLKDHGFHMTGGAGLPVDGTTLEKLKNEIYREFPDDTTFAFLTADRAADLAALIIRSCLGSGMSSHIAYGKLAAAASRKEKSIDPRSVRRANPNDPCPCGSGRKFKSCCGRRPRL